MQLNLIFSFIFFFTLSIELFFGLAVLYVNPKGRINRLLFILSIALAFWSIGLGMSNLVLNVDDVLVWRRIAAIGWTTVHAIFLHLILVLTGQDIKSGKWSYYILYLPALINLYVFSISSKMAAAQHNLVKISSGWINISIHNGWDWFYYIYYLSYIVAGIVLLGKWRLRTTDKEVKRQTSFLIALFIITLLLGTFNDIILTSIIKSPLPQMAPIFNVIPIIGMTYLIQLSGFLREAVEDKGHLILSGENREKLYFYLAIFFLLGGIFSSLPYFLPNLMQQHIEIVSIKNASLFLYLIGVLILVFRFINNHKIKDFLIIGVTILSIPVLSFSFFETAATTIWVFSAILAFFALLFNTKWPLISIIVISMASQIYIWINKSGQIVIINDIHMFIRILTLFAVFIVAWFINRTYIARLSENIYRADSQKIISDITLDLLNTDKKKLPKNIDELLAKLGSFLEIDRTYVFLGDVESNKINDIYIWYKSNKKNTIEDRKDITINDFSWWVKKSTKDNLIKIDITDNINIQKEYGNEALVRQGVKSILAIPIKQHDEITGFIVCESIKTYENWSELSVELLHTISNILGTALIKVEAETTIEHMAYHDHLTGLPNRALFKNKVNKEIESAQEEGRGLGIMFIDLDNFKTVNDTMGHGGGDRLLQEIAHRLSLLLGQGNTVARFSGDEFIIILNNISGIEDIEKLADDVISLFRRPFIVDKNEVFITCSGGIAVYPQDGEDIELLMENANIAMHEAKTNGKNQYVFCSDSMMEKVKLDAELSNDLFRAIEKAELVLHYQPQVNVETEEIIGVEALLRWNHAELGMIPPNIFIPLTEKNGSISTIGEWVLHTACSQNKKWQDMGLPKFKMAINISAVQFNDPFLVDKILETVDIIGLDPKYLDLEITESALSRDDQGIIDTLNRIRKDKISISIDDFGTQYSSLSRLKNLPIDKLKIDMEFVHGIEKSAKERAILQNIIQLAKSMELEVVAEGVETQRQLEFLKANECNIIQGYYYYKPMLPEELEKILLAKIQ